MDAPLPPLPGRLLNALRVLICISAVGMASAPLRANDWSHLDKPTRSLLQQVEAKYQSNMRYLPGYQLEDTDSDPGLPRVFAPTRPRTAYTRYPWKRGITTTIFWVGEPRKGFSPDNVKSSWDTKWMENFGGYDNPDPDARAWDFRPEAFVPGQNPFYVALPYNDLAGWKKHKSTASRVIPWFKERYTGDGDTVIKGQWVAIRLGSKIAYAQWEDVGPFETDDWQYVFGDAAQPKTMGNKKAGLDVSPAVRDFLGMRSHMKTDWRFVEIDEVPTGPWRKYGDNNPFVQIRRQQAEKATQLAMDEKRADQERIIRLREMRDRYVSELE